MEDDPTKWKWVNLPQINTGKEEEKELRFPPARRPKTYLWSPHPDITTYELALITPYLNTMWGSSVEEFFLREPQCARHFVLSD